MKPLICLCAGIMIILQARSQECTTIGQNPSTAFPVCGTTVFKQKTVPLCGNRVLPSRCKADGVTNTNPFWYKFTCFKDGTLGFLITPNNLGDDYDWELYDITGHNPNEVYVDGNLPIACNWSGEKGLTGTSSSVNNGYFVCAGLGKPLFSNMPLLKKGHNYLLLVSHFDPFTNSTDGYTLEFKGGTAVITDTTQPAMQKAEVPCGATKIRLKINKKMLCRSIAGDGSDFLIDPAIATITNASGIGCADGFDTDSLELTLSKALSPGDYFLHIKAGSDGNTLLDICETPIQTDNKVPFRVEVQVPTPMDSLTPVQCSPQELHLVFRKNINCKSIAPDGSDFIVSGTYPVTVTGASGTCTNNLTKEIIVTLSRPLSNQGNFQITLQRGTDGNTLIDECLEETPAGSSLAFSVKDTVNADFTAERKFGCAEDRVLYSHPGGNEVDSWAWNLDEGQFSTIQNPAGLYRQFTNKQVSLVVSNGFCTDSSSQTIVLNNFLKAAFTVPEDNCPLEPITFTSNAIGLGLQHFWNFGDGNTATANSPQHTYERGTTTRTLRIVYTVTDSIGCTSTVEKNINLYVSCIIDVPSAFSPNSDGKNDFLYPLNAVKAEQLEFRVFNRWGQLVYSTNNWKKGWDGRCQSTDQAAGLYIWTLTYTDRDSKKQFSRKGKTLLVR